MKKNILMAMPSYTISQVNSANELPAFGAILRVPVRTREEAETYLKHGVAVFRKDIDNRSFFYVEVAVEDLAKIARKG